MTNLKHPIPAQKTAAIEKFTKAITPAFGLDPDFYELLHAPRRALEILHRDYPDLEDCIQYPLGKSPVDQMVVAIVKKLWQYFSGNAHSGALTEIQMQVKTLCCLAGISDE